VGAGDAAYVTVTAAGCTIPERDPISLAVPITGLDRTFAITAPIVTQSTPIHATYDGITVPATLTINPRPAPDPDPPLTAGRPFTAKTSPRGNPPRRT